MSQKKKQPLGIRKVHNTDDGCSLYECLDCKERIETRTPLTAFNYCPFCARVAYPRITRPSHHPKWHWERVGKWDHRDWDLPESRDTVSPEEYDELCLKYGKDYLNRKDKNYGKHIVSLRIYESDRYKEFSATWHTWSFLVNLSSSGMKEWDWNGSMWQEPLNWKKGILELVKEIKGRGKFVKVFLYPYEDHKPGHPSISHRFYND